MTDSRIFIDVDAPPSTDEEQAAYRATRSCGKCGGPLEEGFGLMGGGYGPYKFCVADDCDWMVKLVLGADDD